MTDTANPTTTTPDTPAATRGKPALPIDPTVPERPLLRADGKIMAYTGKPKYETVEDPDHLFNAPDVENPKYRKMVKAAGGPVTVEITFDISHEDAITFNNAGMSNSKAVGRYIMGVDEDGNPVLRAPDDAEDIVYDDEGNMTNGVPTSFFKYNLPAMIGRAAKQARTDGKRIQAQLRLKAIAERYAKMEEERAALIAEFGDELG